MATAIKVKNPSFYKDSPAPQSEKSGSNLSVYILVVVVGVILVMFMRSRSSNVHTGPVLTLVPSNETDTSAIANMTQAVNALSIPHGGVATPITPYSFS